MTIMEAINKIGNLQNTVADVGISIMKGEIPKRTGALANSVHAEVDFGTVRIIAGDGDVNYARFVNDGRGEIRPKSARALHWVEGHGPYAELPGGGDVFSMRSKPTKPNDFAERTIRRLKSINFNNYI